MGEPCFDAIFMQSAQVATDEIPQDKAMFGVGHLFFKVPRVVMTEFEGTTRLGKVLGRPSLRELMTGGRAVLDIDMTRLSTRGENGRR